MTRAWRAWLGGVLAVAALGFVGATIVSEWSQLRAYDWDVDGAQLAISVVALAAALAWGVWVLGRVLARLTPEPPPFPTLLRIWFLSSLARYVPGKIWQFVGAANMARSAGIAAPVLITAMAIHIGLTLLAAAIVAAGLLAPFGIDLRTAPMIALVVLGLTSLGLVHPKVLNAGLALVPRALHAEVMVWSGSWASGLALLALSITAWLATGAAFTLFVDAVVEVPLLSALPLTGANALAFLVGYLVFLTPAGLGAREAALAVLLGPIAPPGIAAVVAVATRLWTIAGEVLGAVAVLGIGAPAEAETSPPDSGPQ
jgi:glycosyltransferase 2 family protein